jgi:hypothetical protein
MPIEVKSFASQADEAKDMPNARMEAVNVLGQRVMRCCQTNENSHQIAGAA